MRWKCSFDCTFSHLYLSTECVLDGKIHGGPTYRNIKWVAEYSEYNCCKYNAHSPHGLIFPMSEVALPHVVGTVLAQLIVKNYPWKNYCSPCQIVASSQTSWSSSNQYKWPLAKSNTQKPNILFGHSLWNAIFRQSFEMKPDISPRQRYTAQSSIFPPVAS